MVSSIYQALRGDLKMDREPKLFDSKCVDSFSRVVDWELGELSSVLVWHDGTGGGMFGSLTAGWFLDKVRVEHAFTAGPEPLLPFVLIPELFCS